MSVIITRLQCFQCEHEWVPRSAVVSKCPSCRSPYWNDPDYTSLSPLELKARRWLRTQFILQESQIEHHYRQSPDFILPNGSGYEAVPMGNERIVLYGKQWNRLLENKERNYILCFGDGHEPEAIIPMTELPLGTPRWNKLRISWYHKEVSL